MKRRIFLLILTLALIFSFASCGDDTAAACTSHVDADGNEKCDVCAAKLPHTTCKDADKNASCDICGKPVACVTHEDLDLNAYCDVCGQFVPCTTCVDANEDGYCDVCMGFVPCVTHKDRDHNLFCDVCGEAVPCEEHQDVDKNAKCDWCGARVECTTHADADKNQVCDVCGNSTKCVTCVDANHDQECDVCFAPVPCVDHEDVNPVDAKCDFCGATLDCPGHVDDDKNAECDICGAYVPCETCVDENPKDAKCDVCGLEVPCTECVDENPKDAKCDVCGKKVDCKECVDEDHNLKCDVCGKAVACTEHKDDNYDAKCDWCGVKVKCQECIDEDEDGICDICKDEMPLPEGLVLVENGTPKFQIVVIDGAGSDIIKAVNNLIKSLKSQGVTVEWVYDEKNNATDCEIIIGIPKNRGDQYKFDVHELGYNGYAVQNIDGKLLVYGGSIDGTLAGIEYLQEDIFGTGKLKDLVVTSAMETVERPDKYRMDEVRINGTEIKGFTLAINKDDTDATKLAKSIQERIYKETGYWLEIVDVTEADKSIVINNVSKSGGVGFYIRSEGTQLNFISEFANKNEEQVLGFLTKNIFTKTGIVNITSDFDADINVRDLYYKDFGAVGDGITDDFDAMYDCHAYANKYGHQVFGDRGATYYIGAGHGGKTIQIRTNTTWKGCKFILDDSVIAPYLEDGKTRNPDSNTNVFRVAAEHGSFSVPRATIPARLLKDSANVGYAPGFPALVTLSNNTIRHYIRYGGNADNGQAQTETVLVDANGNVDPSTPVMWDYDILTSMTVRRIDDAPITLSGGDFTIRYNQAPSAYTYYDRGIRQDRSNSTITGITHKIEGYGNTGAPHSGFIVTANAYNVTVDNCTFENPKGFSTMGTGGTMVSMGSYSFTGGHCVNITWSNLTLSNFYAEDGIYARSGGQMGSNYCRNIMYTDNLLSSFDAHCGAHNVTVLRSKVEHINCIGGGTIIIEDTEIHAMHQNTVVNLRSDYGSIWKGDAFFKNLNIVTKDDTYVGMFATYWYNHDFGYTARMPETIVLENIKITSLRGLNELRLAVGNITSTNDFHVSSEEVYDGNPNLDRYVPTRTIIVKNNVNNVKITVNNIPSFDDINLREVTPCDHHYDDNKDKHCDVCFDYRVETACVDENTDGICDGCKRTLPECDHYDNNKDGICDGCEFVICSHDFDYVYGFDTKHHWRNTNCRCNVTTTPEPHVDTDGDDKCDFCKMVTPFDCVGEHVDEDQDAKCDACTKVLPCIAECVDKNKNGACDVCNYTMKCKDVECVDTNHDFKCDRCFVSKACTEHEDHDEDGLCDWCKTKSKKSDEE